MKLIFPPAFLLAVFFLSASALGADQVVGSDWYLSSADTIQIVRAQTADAAQLFPPPQGSQRVFVEEVLKGIDTVQEFLLPAGVLKPGQAAVFLRKYSVYSASPAVSVPEPTIAVWPMDAAGLVNTGGVPISPTDDGRWFHEQRNITAVPIGDLKKAIASQGPEGMAQNGEIIDTLLSPQKFDALAKQNPGRATYLRFVLVILDLERDVPALAQLLESPDKSIRLAAEAHLNTLTGATVPAPQDESPRSLHEWSVAWAARALPSPPQWPPIPAKFKMPPAAFPKALVKAVHDNDAAAFAKAFPAWMDSGVMHDRELMSRIQEHDAFSAYLGPYEMMRPETPVQDRLKSIVLMAGFQHHDRILKEQTDRLAFIKAQPPGSEAVRRAAFWELPGSGTGMAALGILGSSPDRASQRLLETICFTHTDVDDAYEAAQASIRAGNRQFIGALLDYMRGHHNFQAEWIGRLLCEENQAAVIPILLHQLKDESVDARYTAAETLCGARADVVSIVPALLAAIRTERVMELKSRGAESRAAHTRARLEMTVALALTGNKRGLDTLLAAAREPSDSLEYVVSALGVIRDKKALPTLARIALGLEWAAPGNKIPEDREGQADSALSLLCETANAFDYISSFPDAANPDDFQSSDMTAEQINQAVQRIKQWQKSRTR